MNYSYFWKASSAIQYKMNKFSKEYMGQLFKPANTFQCDIDPRVDQDIIPVSLPVLANTRIHNAITCMRKYRNFGQQISEISSKRSYSFNYL